MTASIIQDAIRSAISAFIAEAHTLLVNADHKANHEVKKLNTNAWSIEPERVYTGISVYGFTSSMYRPIEIPSDLGHVMHFQSNLLQHISKDVMKSYPQDAARISSMYSVLQEAIKAIPDGKVMLTRYTMPGGHSVIYTFVVLRNAPPTAGNKQEAPYDLIKITLR